MKVAMRKKEVRVKKTVIARRVSRCAPHLPTSRRRARERHFLATARARTPAPSDRHSSSDSGTPQPTLLRFSCFSLLPSA